MAIKFCSSCKEGFNLDQFYTDNTKSDSKRHTCKHCDKKRNANKSLKSKKNTVIECRNKTSYSRFYFW